MSRGLGRRSFKRFALKVDFRTGSARSGGANTVRLKATRKIGGDAMAIGNAATNPSERVIKGAKIPKKGAL